jgi:predicted transcriptional regulator
MKLFEIKEILKAEVISGDDKLDIEVSGGAASDLMSDLLRKPKEGSLLLTGLTSIQAINTSVIGGMAAIVFVRGKKPDQAIVSLARKHKIPILSTPFNMFSSCGRLYARGLRSITWLS